MCIEPSVPMISNRSSIWNGVLLGKYQTSSKTPVAPLSNLNIVQPMSGNFLPRSFTVCEYALTIFAPEYQSIKSVS